MKQLFICIFLSLFIQIHCEAQIINHPITLCLNNVKYFERGSIEAYDVNFKSICESINISNSDHHTSFELICNYNTSKQLDSLNYLYKGVAIAKRIFTYDLEDNELIYIENIKKDSVSGKWIKSKLNADNEGNIAVVDTSTTITYTSDKNSSNNGKIGSLITTTVYNKYANKVEYILETLEFKSVEKYFYQDGLLTNIKLYHYVSNNTIYRYYDRLISYNESGLAKTEVVSEYKKNELGEYIKVSKYKNKFKYKFN